MGNAKDLKGKANGTFLYFIAPFDKLSHFPGLRTASTLLERLGSNSEWILKLNSICSHTGPFSILH